MVQDNYELNNDCHTGRRLRMEETPPISLLLHRVTNPCVTNMLGVKTNGLADVVFHCNGAYVLFVITYLLPLQQGPWQLRK